MESLDLFVWVLHLCAHGNYFMASGDRGPELHESRAIKINKQN